jgi:hypothetical protein
MPLVLLIDDEIQDYGASRPQKNIVFAVKHAGERFMQLVALSQ